MRLLDDIKQCERFDRRSAHAFLRDWACQNADHFPYHFSSAVYAFVHSYALQSSSCESGWSQAEIEDAVIRQVARLRRKRLKRAEHGKRSHALAVRPHMSVQRAAKRCKTASRSGQNITVVDLGDE